MGADGLEHRQGLGVAIDIALQLGTAIADVCRVDEDRRNPGIDQGRLEGADTGHFQVVHQVAGGEHRTARTLFLGCRVKELQLHFGRRESHAVQLEVAGFLDLTVGDRHVGDDALADIGLPDAHHRHAVLRNARRVHQAAADGEGAHCRREVAAVAAPVDKGLVDGHLAEQVVDVVVGLDAPGQDHRLAGAGRGAAHAVDLLVIGIGAADHPQQQGVTGCARQLGRLGQVLQVEEHALAGAATHVGGGNLDLRYECHEFQVPIMTGGGALRPAPGTLLSWLLPIPGSPGRSVAAPRPPRRSIPLRRCRGGRSPAPRAARRSCG